MRVLVTGSIATDHLMLFPGRFAEQVVDTGTAALSLSFLVDSLDVRNGGVAANVSVGLSRLGVNSTLVGAVGSDFTDYRARLAELGVDTSSILVSPKKYTARFLCTTDLDHAQISSFHPGAMSDARQIELRPIVERVGGARLVLISPNDPGAMLRHTEECRRNGYPFAADPSQRIGQISAGHIKALVEGATLLFTNEAERATLLAKTGWTKADVLSRVGMWVTTLGERGAQIEIAATEPVLVRAVNVKRPIDPTGIGDGFRAGFLAGMQWGLGYQRSAQVGCTLASFVFEGDGPQEYEVEPVTLLDRIQATYGPDTADDVAPHLMLALNRGGWS
ncbi:MAG: carbohydrate kinase family protein [Kibdelosporangium sp.]